MVPRGKASSVQIRQRRDEILAAAYRVFAARGYHHTTIAHIAAELGIGHGTFYRYFDNKLDIFRQVVGTAIERVATVVSEQDPQSTETLDEYRAQVKRIGRRLFDLLRQDEPIARLLFYEAVGISPELNEEIQRAWDLFGTFTELYLKNGQNKGFLRAGLDTRTTALAINAMIFEGGRRIVTSRDREQLRDDWIAAATALMFDGVANRLPAEPTKGPAGGSGRGNQTRGKKE